MKKIKKIEGWRYTDEDRFREIIVNKINELIDSQNALIKAQTESEKTVQNLNIEHAVFGPVKQKGLDGELHF